MNTRAPDGANKYKCCDHIVIITTHPNTMVKIVITIRRYASHPKQQPGELVGFTVPEWMIEKMKVILIVLKRQTSQDLWLDPEGYYVWILKVIHSDPEGYKGRGVDQVGRPD